jgi:hypothetical protein
VLSLLLKALQLRLLVPPTHQQLVHQLQLQTLQAQQWLQQ